MTKEEKYRDEIVKKYPDGSSFCSRFVKKRILPDFEMKCRDLSCAQCNTLQQMWLKEEYKEPETDWSKVPVDTPIYVKESILSNWLKRHFAKYENGNVYAYAKGCTSFTGDRISRWDYAKLAQEGVE